MSQPLFGDIVDTAARALRRDRRPAQVGKHPPEEIAAALADLRRRAGHAQRSASARPKWPRAPRLRAIANVGVGYNNLDVPALTAAGILVTNTPDVLTETTADFGFALMMAAARRITEAERWLRDGQWRQWSFETMLGGDVHGATLGILGMGRIGQGIARRRRASACACCTTTVQRLPAEVERECARSTSTSIRSVAQADHLILVLPYSPAVHHLDRCRRAGEDEAAPRP